MCIITKSDLSRIYGNLDRRQRDKDAIRQEIETKQEMVVRSAQITRHWPNTIVVNKSFIRYF
jgi:cell division septal protein FtsQ